MKWLKYLGLFYLISIIALAAQLFKDSYCISSTIVESVNIQRSSGGVVQFPSCIGPTSEVISTPRFDDLKLFKIAQKQIQEFEESIFRSQWDYAIPKKEIVIFEDGLASKIEGSINVSIVELKNKDVFRKKLALNWISEIRKKYDKTDLLAEEILSDILTFMVWGNVPKDLFNNNAEHFIFSEKSICTSKWRPLHMEEVCETIKKSSIDSFNKISDWSIRPLFLKAFYTQYFQMSLEKKLSFNKAFLSKALNFDIQLKEGLKISNLHEVLNKLSGKFLNFEGTTYKRFFKNLWTYKNKSVSNEATFYLIGSNYFNALNGSYFDMESLVFQRVYVDQDVWDEVQIPADIHTKYVVLNKKWMVHLPSLKIAQRLHKNALVLGSLKDLKGIEKVTGWNPVLPYVVDQGI